MNREWAMVRAFHEAFGAQVSDEPVMLDPALTNARAKWMREEVDEFVESKDKYEQADAMIDLIYFALGTLVSMGIKPDEAFRIVHEANMSKRWPDGEVHRNADGKVIKSPAWRDPRPLVVEAIDKQ